MLVTSTVPPKSSFFKNFLQIHFGDLPQDRTSKSSSGSAASASGSNLVTQALDRFFPQRYADPETRSDDEQALAEKWATLKAKDQMACVRIFLTCTRKWQFFGAKLFEVQVNVKKIVIYPCLNKIRDLDRTGRSHFQCVVVCGRGWHQHLGL